MVRFIAALLLLVSIDQAWAEGIFLEIGAGTSRMSTRENGTWYQDNRETNNNLSDHSLQIGLAGYFTRKDPGRTRYGWRVAYVDLGRFESNNIATNDDADWNKPDRELHCNSSTGEHCLARFMGTGGAYGGTLGLFAEREWRGLAVGIEGGAFLYRSWWNVRVLHYQDCAWDVNVCGGVFNYDRATGSGRTFYYGYTARYTLAQSVSAYAALRYYHDVTAQGKGTGGACGDVGLFGHRARQISVGVSVEF